MNGGRTEEGYSSGLPNKVFFNKSISRYDESRRKLFFKAFTVTKNIQALNVW